MFVVVEVKFMFYKKRESVCLLYRNFNLGASFHDQGLFGVLKSQDFKCKISELN